MLFLFIRTLSILVISIAPFVVLPISILFSTHLALLVSAIFLIHYLLVGVVTWINKDFWDSISVLAEIPLLCAVAIASYYALPDGVIVLYKHALDWAGPVLVIVEGLQLTRCILFSGKFVMKLAEDYPDKLPLIKVLVIGGSLVCYLISTYLAYTMYAGSSINIAFASFISSLVTILLVLNVLSVVTDNAVLTDAALLSVYTLQCCRLALLQYTASEQKAPSGFFTSVLSNLQVTFDRIFTTDYLLASALPVIALVTLSLPIMHTSADDDGFSYGGQEQSTAWQILKNCIFRVLGLTLFTHLLLHLVGHITTFSVFWRVAQVIFCVSYYSLTLLTSTSPWPHPH